MKYKYFNILFLFLLINYVLYGDNTKTIQFISEANDLAYINLELKNNGRFCLLFKDISTNKTNKLRGSWIIEDNNYKLKFNGLRTPKIKVLFNTKEIKILDKRTVFFSKYTTKIWIWGIYCKKQ